MNVVTIDFETYWSQTHTLSKMDPISYVMHEDTDIISMAIKVGDAETEVFFGEDDIATRLGQQDWSKALVVGHNMSEFDSMILAWRFGVKPAMWGCTLAMARPIHSKTTGNSLAKLVEHYKLGTKNQAVLHNTRGKRLSDFTDEELRDMATYNKADTDQCYALFQKLLPQTPMDELRLIHQTVCMLVHPSFRADTDLLQKALRQEINRKAELVLVVAESLGVTSDEVTKTLASAPKFKAFLESRGVECPMKVSKTTGKDTPALAKTDQEFLALQEHEDELVSAAAMARLGVKSTLLETRIGKFLSAAHYCDGWLPMPLHYCGADTTGRWSGYIYNPQNLPRVSPGKDKISDALRLCMKAPPGYKVVVADLSGIELRMNHFLWQVPASMALYQADPEKADLYKDFASKLYNVPVAEVTKAQRQVGKLAHLGLGYGAGAATFRTVAKLMGGVDLLPDEAKAIVDTWRNTYPEIVRGWRTCHDNLGMIAAGAEAVIDPWGMVKTSPQGFQTPKYLIRYPQLRQELNEKGKPEWVYGEGRNKARIYAGKCVENIVQCLSRSVIADAALNISRTKLGKLYPLALSVHDELVYVVREEHAQEMLDLVQSIMRTPPAWFPELITWSEGDIADSYGDAK